MLLDFAWRDLNLRRITAQVFADNARAIASYRKAGFVEEGRLRDGAFIDGAWTDVVIVGAVNPTA